MRGQLPSGPGDESRPLILTLALDGASFAYLDGLRRAHFPPARNMVPAHVTLFHALPGSERASVMNELAAMCRLQAPFSLAATGLRSLGRGVAIALASPEFVALRQRLMREWRDWLTAQDSAKIAPHVTVQNKASPDAARALLATLQAEFRPFVVRGEGLHLWRYLDGPWRLERSFRFTGG